MSSKINVPKTRQPPAKEKERPRPRLHQLGSEKLEGAPLI